MDFIRRDLLDVIRQKLQPGKVLIIFGARRVGKTMLIEAFLNQLEEPYLPLSGDDINTHDVLAKVSTENYKQLLGNYRLLFIDEAQKIPNIGNKLKLMVDTISDLRVIVSGSSSFDMQQDLGEPLTGRKYSFTLYGVSENEFTTIETPLQKKDKLEERLIYGSYPELLHLPNKQDKKDYLNEMVNSYLLKDILIYENIKSAQKIFNLLRLIAFQIGGEVSMQEIGSKLNISKNTVEKYLDVLSKVFILKRVEGFSRNMRKEVTKNARYYFLDNGIRNAIIANFNEHNNRNDIGALWENYLVAERLKFQQNNRMSVNNYFWRTYQKQELDWVEERDGNLFGFEFKWKRTKISAPKQWAEAYPEAHFEVIHQDNYLNWLT